MSEFNEEEDYCLISSPSAIDKSENNKINKLEQSMKLMLVMINDMKDTIKSNQSDYNKKIEELKKQYDMKINTISIENLELKKTIDSSKSMIQELKNVINSVNNNIIENTKLDSKKFQEMKVLYDDKIVSISKRIDNSISSKLSDIKEMISLDEKKIDSITADIKALNILELERIKEIEEMKHSYNKLDSIFDEVYSIDKLNTKKISDIKESVLSNTKTIDIVNTFVGECHKDLLKKITNLVGVHDDQTT